MTDTEVGEGRTDEERARLACEEGLRVVVGTDLPEQECRVGRVGPRLAFFGLGPTGVDQFLPGLRRTTDRPPVSDEVPCPAVEDPAEVAWFAYRPGDRGGPQANLIFDVVEQFEGVATRSVQKFDLREPVDTQSSCAWARSGPTPLMLLCLSSRLFGDCLCSLSEPVLVALGEVGVVNQSSLEA